MSFSETTAGWVLVILFLVLALSYISRKSKERKETITDTVFQYSYKTRVTTWFLYAFAFYVTLLGIITLFITKSRMPWFYVVIFLSSPLLSAGYVWVANWIYQDAKRRKMKSGVWGLSATTNLWPLILLFYLYRRKKNPVQLSEQQGEQLEIKALIKPTIIWFVCAILVAGILYFSLVGGNWL